MKKIFILFTIILLSFLVLNIGCIKKESNQDELSYPIYSNGQRYEATASINIVNPGKYLNNLDVWMIKPVEWNSQQNVSMINITPVPSFEYMDNTSGNGVYKWSFTSLSKESNLTIVQKFYFISYQIDFNIDPIKVKDYNTSNLLYIEFTKSEDIFQSDDPNIVEMANTIIGNEKNKFLQSKKLFHGVAEYMTNENTVNDEGAKYALLNKKGDCFEYSALYIALCRSSGIPARPVYGVFTNNSSRHAWVEIYFENIGWVPADPYNYDLYGPNQYEFGHIPNKLLILSKGAISIPSYSPQNGFLVGLGSRDNNSIPPNIVEDIFFTFNKI